MFASAILALAALAHTASATVFITSPVASTNWAAGQQQTLSWQDDGASPSLKDFGPAKVSLAVGNAIQQTPVQVIAEGVDVSTTASIVFTPDANAGANGNMYFIRVESISLKDPKTPQYPALSFSAKFTMSGMTGTFNSTVQAQIDGASTAPIGGATPSSAPSSTGSPASVTAANHAASGAPSASKASTTPSASAKADHSGAMTTTVSTVFALAGSAAVLAAMML
ncbi:hypothetical protein K474DRAFT_1672632 [Panus rudis PR-1116 ss-1]|nr:hypothetical protein K474DRAFT_1672632 [Panus rudis PR-1116 ss-1]